MAEREVIIEVLEFLSKTINLGYKILKYPDEIERKLPACDMLATVGSRNVAIEHTSIDSFPFQRRDNDWFIKCLGPLKNELAGKLPAPGHYRLSVHVNVIPTGVKWDDVRLSIRRWCQKVAPTLEIGDSFTAHRHFVREMPQGVPFKVTLSRRPGQNGQFKIDRFSPEDLKSQSIEVIRQALVSRGTKVAKDRNDGSRTILILESNDIILADYSDIGQAFVSAINEFKSMQLLDEVYLVETEAAPWDVYCLKFGDTLFPNVAISKEPYV